VWPIIRQDYPTELQTDLILPSRRLERIASVLKEGRRHTVGDIADRFGRSGFGFVILLLGMPALIPIPGPFGLVFGTCLALTSLQVLAGAEQLWLPARVRRIEIDGGKLSTAIGHVSGWLRRAERWIVPRRGPSWILTHLGPVTGLPVLLLSVMIALPVPLGNILPCVALIFLALGLIAEDGLAIVAGLVVGAIAAAWMAFLFTAGTQLAEAVWSATKFFWPW
jgi:hypothetical protein